MKRFFVFTMAILLIFSLSGCGIAFAAERKIEDSEIYSEREISSAMDIVSLKFAKDFHGCILYELSYSDKNADAAKAWASQYKAEEAIVIYSDFHVFTEGSGGLEVGDTYEGWSWILVRDKGEKWELKTWGYA